MVKKKPPTSFSENITFGVEIEQHSVLSDVMKNETPQAPSRTAKPHYEGHRQRLRKRFLENNGNGLADYEYLELLLFRSVPRSDTKPLAKALIHRFGSLSGVLNAELSLLQDVTGCGPAIALDLKIISKTLERSFRSQVINRDAFSSWDKVLAYCKAAMAYETKEQFRILFLDKKNCLIIDEVQQIGTVDHTPVYPREVLKRALELSASALILIHNHPSGDPTPSREDVAMTQKLKEAASVLNITIHDHIIIGRNGYTSLKAQQLL